MNADTFVFLLIFLEHVLLFLDDNVDKECERISVLYKQHFYNTFNARLKLKKNQANAKDTLRLNFCYLKIIRILHLRYHPKIVGRF